MKEKHDLLKSDDFFRQILSALPDGVTITDTTGKILQVNPKILKLYGCEKESDVVGTLATDWVAPESLEKARTNIEKLFRGIVTTDNEYLLLKKDGSTFHGAITAALLTDDKGDPAGMIATTRDITLRKQTEETLRKKNQDLDSLLKVSQMMATTLDLSTVLQVIVEQAVLLTGLDTGAIYLIQEEVLYLGATTPPLPADFPELLRQTPLTDHPSIQSAISSGEPLILPDTGKAKLSPAEKVIVENRKLTSILYLPLMLERKAVGILILGTMGRTVSFSKEEKDLSRTMAYQAALSIVNAGLYKETKQYAGRLEQEIAERKKTEKTLRESDNYNRFLFETSPTGLALCRMDGTLVDVNPAYAAIIGRTVEETELLSYWDITPEKYRELEEVQLELLRTTGAYGPYEKEYIHADGHLVPVRLFGRIIEQRGEQYIWSSMDDITEQVLSEAKLKDQLNELKRWQTVMIGQEERNIELKKEVNDLLKQLGRPEKYGT